MKPKMEKPAVLAAADRGDEAGVVQRIAAGDMIDDRDFDGRTALHVASMRGDLGIVRVLLAAGADANARDKGGWAPLHFAARAHHLELADALIRAGAQLESEDAHGNTPLARAVFACQGRGEMIVFLRSLGASPDHANHRGVTPRSLAATIANFDVARWL